MGSRKPEGSLDAASPGSRRSFFWKLGAGVSTAVAATAGMGATAARGTDDAVLKAALLEEEKVLRGLHQAFTQAMDAGRYDDAAGMFTAGAEVIFNGSTFSQRNKGVSRLFRELFQPAGTGRGMEQAPGFELDAAQLADSVDVAANRLSATAAFPYSIQVGMPVETPTSLAAMARLHGGGVQTWWEGGAYHARYARDTVDDRWMISRLEYRTLSRADYRPGRTWATAMPVSPIPAEQLERLRNA